MDDLRVRWAGADDARGVAVVHVDSWREAYRGLIDQSVLDALSVDQRSEGWSHWIDLSLSTRSNDGAAAPHRLLVTEVGGQIAGWASFGAGRDPGMSQLGELAGIYVHPAQWSTGVGNALLGRVERELLAESFTDGYLWVLRGNDRATRFYERHGWHADGVEKTGEAGGVTGLHEIRHSRRLSAEDSSEPAKEPHRE